MKILVTGGAGFIGYHLVQKLRESHDVTVIDKRNGINASMLTDDDLDGIECIFHLAANSDISNGFRGVEFSDTFYTTFYLLSLCSDLGIKQFVFASSSAIYGEHDKPITEDTAPLQPISHYGAAKLASEAFISSFAYQYGIQSWILRFPNVVGDHATHGVLLDLLRKHKENPDRLEVLGDGSQLKPYIHVSELVEAMIFIWMNAKEPLNVYNISGVGRTSVKEIAEMITDKEIVYTGGEAWKGDCKQYLYDTSKLRKLGWMPKINSNAAIERAIKEIWEQLQNT